MDSGGASGRDVAAMRAPLRDAAAPDVSTPRLAKALIDREAAAAGFSVVGNASLADLGCEAGERFRAFLDLGRHGDMDWLEAKADRRRHPNAMWSDARSAIVLGLSYAPDDDPLRFLDERSRASISVYATRRDYHDVVKPRLKRVARALQAATGDAERHGGQREAHAAASHPRRSPSRLARSISRRTSFSAMEWRLSCVFLPLPTPISSLA